MLPAAPIGAVILLAAVTSSPRADAERPAEQTVFGTLTLNLRDGSRLVGRPKVDVLLLDSDIGTTEVPLARIARLETTDPAGTVVVELRDASYLASETGSDIEILNRLRVLSGQLIEDIQTQRDLCHADTGTLKTQPVPLKIHQTLDDLRLQYLKHTVSAKRGIRISETSDVTIITDKSPLMRVLGNMLKNALEAASPGGVVSLACSDHGDTVTFAVNNPEVMPQEVQLQVFQRSFSTKEQVGRGIGTHSMKLFGEDYLGGKVDFTSHEPEGTTFRLTLPKDRPPLP